MPEIGHLEQQELSLPVNVMGNIIVVTYRPFGITMDASVQQLLQQSKADMSGLYDAFVSTVSAWDLYEDGGAEMVPITHKRLASLPATLVMLVLEACMADKPERQEHVRAGKAPGRISIDTQFAGTIVDYLAALSLTDQAAADIVNELRDAMEA